MTKKSPTPGEEALVPQLTPAQELINQTIQDFGDSLPEDYEEESKLVPIPWRWSIIGPKTADAEDNHLLIGMIKISDGETTIYSPSVDFLLVGDTHYAADSAYPRIRPPLRMTAYR